VDVGGLPDGEVADDARVGDPGVRDTGGSFVAPHVADELAGGFDDAAGDGQVADGFGVGGAHQPDAAVGGVGDAFALVVVVAESLPGLGGDLDAQAEGPAALGQLVQGQAAGYGGVVVAGQQDRTGLGAAGGGGAADQLGQGQGLCPRSRRYQVTANGLTIALFLTRLAQRFLIPGLAQLTGTGPPADTRLRHADRAYKAAITDLAEQASLAA